METPLVAVCDKGSLVHENRKAKVLANSYIPTSSLFLLGAFSAPATKMEPLVHCCSNDRARPGLARVPTDARYEDSPSPMPTKGTTQRARLSRGAFEECTPKKPVRYHVNGDLANTTTNSRKAYGRDACSGRSPTPQTTSLAAVRRTSEPVAALYPELFSSFCVVCGVPFPLKNEVK